MMVVKLKTILLQTQGPWGSVRCAQVPFTCVQLVNKIVVTPVTLGVTFAGQCIEEALTCPLLLLEIVLVAYSASSNWGPWP